MDPTAPSELQTNAPNPTPAPRQVCAYLAVEHGGSRVIDLGFVAAAPHASAPIPTPTILTKSPAASAYCHPLPPLVPVTRQ